MPEGSPGIVRELVNAEKMGSVSRPWPLARALRAPPLLAPGSAPARSGLRPCRPGSHVGRSVSEPLLFSSCAHLVATLKVATRCAQELNSNGSETLRPT